MQQEFLENHPFFESVYKDLLSLDHSYQGKTWPIGEFLSNLYSLLNNYLRMDLPDKLNFYDAYLYKKYKNRRKGHQFTLEFLVSWVKYYEDHLEVRVIHQICKSPHFTNALKFLLKGRKIAMAINNLDPVVSWSSDEIFLDKTGVVNLCNQLFGADSDSEKIWKWIQQEKRHIEKLSNSRNDIDGVK